MVFFREFPCFATWMVWVSLCCGGVHLFAQLGNDARRAGMGFSNAAHTEGLEQVGLNPAMLAMPYRYNLEINLVSGIATFKNNAFNKDQYDRLFASGDSLSELGKEEILQAVPAGGLRGNALAQINTLAFYTRYFSLSLLFMGRGRFTLPRDFIELPLRGNTKEGRIYQLGQVDGIGWAAAALAFSIALPLEGHEGALGFRAIGITAKYISGLRYGEILESDGRFQNFDATRPSLQLDAHYRARTAEGGRGLGLDVGAVLQPTPGTQVGLTLVNLTGSIRWDTRTKMHVADLQANDFSLPSNVSDSQVSYDDSTYATGHFTTHLPAVLDVAASWQPSSHLLLTAEWEQGLNRSMGASTKPRLAIGGELKPLPLLPLRAGLSLGGAQGRAIALGAGLDLTFWKLDLAYLVHDGLLPGNSKGFSLAATTRFRF